MPIDLLADEAPIDLLANIPSSRGTASTEEDSLPQWLGTVGTQRRTRFTQHSGSGCVGPRRSF